MQKKDAEKFTLEYLKKIGLKAARNTRQFWNNIQDKYGEKIFTDLNKAEAKPGAEINLYDTKNSNFELSMDFSRYSADLYRRFFEWFLQNVSFQDNLTILDLCCDNGLVTCFFGLLYPNSKVIGIDQCENGIKCAEQLKHHLGLNNVDFRIGKIQDLEKLFVDINFNLITSIRNLHEVTGLPKLPKKIWSLESLENMEYDVPTDLKKLLLSIKKLLTSNGLFISMERLACSETTFLYLKELQKAGLFINCDLYKRVQFHELGDQQEMPLIVATKQGDNQNILENVLKIYCNRYNEMLEKNLELTGIDAEYQFNKLKDKTLLKGFQVNNDIENSSHDFNYCKDTANCDKLRLEAWKSEDFIICYTYSNIGYRSIRILDRNDIDNILESFEQKKKSFIEIGNNVSSYTSIKERDELE